LQPGRVDGLDGAGNVLQVPKDENGFESVPGRNFPGGNQTVCLVSCLEMQHVVSGERMTSAYSLYTVPLIASMQKPLGVLQGALLVKRGNLSNSQSAGMQAHLQTSCSKVRNPCLEGLHTMYSL